MDAKREIEKCVFFIQNVFKYKKFNRAVIGVSGGLDSSVVVDLCSRALGPRNVIGYMLPYDKQSDISDSKTICKKYNIEWVETNIKPIVDQFNTTDRYRLGNIMARVRMMVLYNASTMNNALVVGTSNKTELELGYFTLFGDSACALAPIGHLYKTQVREIAKALKIPKNIITKPPTAGLWSGQTDEQDLGCKYEIIDKVLYRYNSITTDMNNWREWKLQEIVENIKDFAKVDYDTISKIIDRKNKNAFKLQRPEMLGALK